MLVARRERMDTSNGLLNLSLSSVLSIQKQEVEMHNGVDQLHDRFVEIVIEGETQLGIFR